MIYRPLRLEWSPLQVHVDPMFHDDYVDSSRAMRRLAKILKSWENTPYMDGQGHRGVGANCVLSTVLILAEWMRWRAPKLELLPPDTQLHSKRGAFRGLRRIRRALPPHSRLRHAKRVQPGDVLITGHPSGGPGHSMIVGTEQNTVWQMLQGSGFQRCGWALPAEYARLFAVLRFDDRTGAV